MAVLRVQIGMAQKVLVDVLFAPPSVPPPPWRSGSADRRREAAPEAHRGAHRRAKAKLSGTAALSFVPSASFDGDPASPAIHRRSGSG